MSIFSKLNIPQPFIPELDLYAKQFGVRSELEVAHFMSQAAHESQHFKKLEENLNYSAERLIKVFPKYFKELVKAKQYERNPKAIASYVYANRMGNGEEASGDGWAYRGRGLFMFTGKYLYDKIGKEFGEDFISNPDLLKTAEWATKTALWYWRENKLSTLVTGDNEIDCKKITLQINGGYNHLKERVELFKTTLAILMSKR
jgi:putative chitinase